MTRFAPKDLHEASDIIRQGGPFQITGPGTKAANNGHDQLSSQELTGIADWSPEDLVVTVRAGMKMADLNAELARRNQCIPCTNGSAGGLIATNPQMPWDGWPFDARYWILGLRAIRGDGTPIRCGSRAVKNVAGYDVQKLFVGSWGSLGFITEATFRVFPLQEIVERIATPPIVTKDTPNADLMLAIKNVFDPKRKFNPGVMGLF